MIFFENLLLFTSRQRHIKTVGGCFRTVFCAGVSAHMLRCLPAQESGAYPSPRFCTVLLHCAWRASWLPPQSEEDPFRRPVHLQPAFLPRLDVLFSTACCMFSHIPIEAPCQSSSQQIAACVSDRAGAVIISQPIGLADLCDHHSIGFHGRKSFLWKTAGFIRVRAFCAFRAAAGTDGQHVRILLPEDPLKCVEMLLM